MNKSAAIIALSSLLVSLCGGFQISLGSEDLSNLRDQGVPTLSAAISSGQEAVNVAVEEFIPVNETCTDIRDAAIETCKSCVTQKCSDRAKAVCKPEEWQVILQDTIGFFQDDVPDFFSKTVPDVFVNKIGGGIVDATNDVGNFVENTVGGGIVDAANFIGDGVVDLGEGAIDLGNTIAGGAVDLGKDIVNVGENFGKDVINLGEDIGKGVVDIGNQIGGALSDLLGKRRRRRSVAAEPSCNALKSDANTACQVYLGESFCPSCHFNSTRDCPGFKAALDKVLAAYSDIAWMKKITSNQYTVSSMSFDFRNADESGSRFTGVQTSVQLFGKDLAFTVSQAINPYEDVAGPIVAQQALELFKSS